jgi:exopolysaccharide production protein ExoQ
MATTVIQGVQPRTRSLRSMPQLVLGWVLVIPLVFFAVHGTPSFEGAEHGRGDEGNSSLSGLASTGRKAGILGSVVIPGVAFSIVMWFLVTNAKPIFSMALQMRLLTLLALFTICSAAWSQDPFRSALNGSFYLIETLFAFYLVLKFETEELLSLAMMTGVVISLTGLIMVFLFPQYAVAQSLRDGIAWTGLFSDRTSTGKTMVFLLSPAVIFRRRSLNYYHLGYVLLLGFLIFMAHAATARVITMLYFGLMAAVYLYGKFGRRSSLIIAGLLLSAGVVVAGVGVLFLPQLLNALGRNATLSGRTEIWNLVLVSIGKRPLLGYGFYAFWLGLRGESARLIVGTNWVFGYAHNGILEIWLQLGLVGVGLFLITLFQGARNAWICLRGGCPPGFQWYIGIIALTMLYNVDESTVLWPIDLLSILYLVACTTLAIRARQIRQIETIEAMYK